MPWAMGTHAGNHRLFPNIQSKKTRKRQGGGIRIWEFMNLSPPLLSQEYGCLPARDPVRVQAGNHAIIAAICFLSWHSMSGFTVAVLCTASVEGL